MQEKPLKIPNMTSLFKKSTENVELEQTNLNIIKTRRRKPQKKTHYLKWRKLKAILLQSGMSTIYTLSQHYAQIISWAGVGSIHL